MGELIDAMKKRISVRSYTDRPVEQAVKDRIQSLLAAHNHGGPFGNRVRLSMIDLSDTDQAETRGLGTYGFIRGARLYVACIVSNGPGALEDAGYCLENAIVGITELGLGTCWLGGTFSRASFARRLGLSQDEVIPAISPIGYGREKRTVRERVLRGAVRADHRKPWDEMFFEGRFGKPLSKKGAGDYATALECLRWAPSASNRQPWRIVKAEDACIFHLLLKRSPGYGKLMPAADLQRVDMGIAMSHFELAARETELDGDWKAEEARLDFDKAGAEYVTTWVGK